MKRYELDYNWAAESSIGISVKNVRFMPPAYHENVIEILYCLKGEVRYSGFYNNSNFVLRAGDFVSNDGDVYYLESDKDNILVSFYFDLKKIEEKDPKYKYLGTSFFACENTAESRIKELDCYYHQVEKQLLKILAIKYIYKGSNCECSKIFNTSAKKIIDCFINHFDVFFYDNPGSIMKDETYGTYQKMHSYLNQHYGERIFLKEMAAAFNYAESYLSSLLRNLCGGYQGALKFIRVSNSERFLLFSNDSIATISEKCGFSDVKYYYSAFREYFNLSPGEFRAKYKDLDQREADIRETLPHNEIADLLTKRIIFKLINEP